MKVRFYRFRFKCLPVTLHLGRDREFCWTVIFGLQLGSWFLGTIRGTEVEGSEH